MSYLPWYDKKRTKKSRLKLMRRRVGDEKPGYTLVVNPSTLEAFQVPTKELRKAVVQHKRDRLKRKRTFQRPLP